MGVLCSEVICSDRRLSAGRIIVWESWLAGAEVGSFAVGFGDAGV
jgi:hypothetical protein